MKILEEIQHSQSMYIPKMFVVEFLKINEFIQIKKKQKRNRIKIKDD